MKKEEAKKRIEKLKKVINYHRYLYHVLDKPEISDAALDSLKHELYNLEQEFPEFITKDSPTQRVGGKALAGFKKIKHEIAMLSIEDIFSAQELQDWENYLKRMDSSDGFEYFSELKIDGFAISLIYEKGLFFSGSTRGDGKTGEDVTQNIKTIESIPLRLEVHKPFLKNSKINKDIIDSLENVIEKGTLEVRGEVYMGKKDFDRLNKQLMEKGEKTFANPRNLAAGSIRQLDPRLAASRPLKFLAYDIITDFGQIKHSQEHQLLLALGFKADQGKICKDISQVVDYWQKILQDRNKLPFQIDGVVVSLNNNEQFEKMGVVGKSPRAVRALKFPPKEATTLIKDIKVQVGRTGAVTPVAILKPTEIDGVTVSRATLHNQDEIQRLKLKIGDTVLIVRAGDVIPAVVKVFPELRQGNEKDFKMPEVCPSCGTVLAKLENEAIWRCDNLNCFARRKKQFYHFVSKKAFDISGLGPKIIDRFSEEKLVSDAADLFSLKESDISPLPGFDKKSANNLVTSIQSKKEISLARFIYSLGIRNVGEETAYLLAEKFKTWSGFRQASLSDLENIEGIGPIAAESIHQFLNEKTNLKFIRKLKEKGIKVKNLHSDLQSSILKGATFALTGSLKSMSREKAEKEIYSRGGKVTGSVSRKADFLVAGENPGSKIEKARKLNVKIINEEDFLKMIK